MDLYEQLKAPLPGWALKPHPTKRGMTTINPVAVIDRLNSVLGPDGWDAEYFDVEIVEYDTEHKASHGGTYQRHHRMVVKKCRLKVPVLGRVIEQYGGNDNDDPGDAHKGAATDALTKCASYIGVGMHVWTNNAPLSERSSERGEHGGVTQEQSGRPTRRQIELIRKFLQSHVFTDDEKARYSAILQETGRDWAGMIDFLKTTLEERKQKEEEQ